MEQALMKPVVVAIDIQNEYFDPHGKWVLPEGPTSLERINALLAAARELAVPVIYLRHEELGATSGVFVPGTPGVEMYPGLHMEAEEPCLTKHFPGSFTQTPLAAHLRHLDADALVICGYMTQLCCDTTTRQAEERGFRVLFAADGTASRSLKLNDRTISHAVVQETTLAVMTQFAEVLGVDQIKERLQEFKR
jgi:nicotinamidase-related amidase